ncbi:MAG: hypothetical protein FJ087_11375 [Deltaproteobacteria bacterium]|nr:hypothetical protein [Deltaproteobacteria bacterium]
MDDGTGTARRGVAVAIALALGAAGAGFAVGLRPQFRPDAAVAPGAPSSPPADVMPATPYRALRDRRAGPARAVTSDLAVLRALLPAATDPVIRTPGDRARAVDARAAGRAYDGAPPVVPHPADERSSAACLACHGSGMRVADRTAPVMSHEPRSQCLQCHAGGVRTRPGTEEVTVANAFSGLASAGPGARAWEGAPPTIPHGTWMREDCASCHGVAGLEGLRTTHPARKICTQCHVPAATPLPFGGGA